MSSEVEEITKNCLIDCEEDRPERICRYCKKAQSQALIQPCYCSGKLQFSHPSCLKKWISQKTSIFPEKLQSSANNLSSIKCEFCFSQISFQVQSKWRMKISLNLGLLFFFMLLWNHGFYCCIFLFQNKIHFFMIWTLVLMGNFAGFYIFRNIFLFSQIVLKQQQVSINNQKIYASDHCCTCLQASSEKLIKICQCVHPQRKFHEACVKEQIRRYIEKVPQNKKVNSLTCNFCEKQIRFEIKKGKKLNSQKYLKMILLVTGLLIWNIFIIAVNLKIAYINFTFDLKIMGLYTYANIHFGDKLAKLMKKDRFQKQIHMKIQK